MVHNLNFTEMNSFIIAGVIGPWQIVLIVAVALLLFGGRKIPELMKGIGEGINEFKRATKGENNPENKDQGKIEK